MRKAWLIFVMFWLGCVGSDDLAAPQTEICACPQTQCMGAIGCDTEGKCILWPEARNQPCNGRPWRGKFVCDGFGSCVKKTYSF